MRRILLTQIQPVSTNVDLFSRATISMILALKTDFLAWVDYMKTNSCIFTFILSDKRDFHFQLVNGKPENPVVSSHFHFPFLIFLEISFIISDLFFYMPD